MGGEILGGFYTRVILLLVYDFTVLYSVSHKKSTYSRYDICNVNNIFGHTVLEVFEFGGNIVHMITYHSCVECYRLIYQKLKNRQDMELGKCGRSLRSLASPVLRACGAPSSDILLYPMLGLS